MGPRVNFTVVGVFVIGLGLASLLVFFWLSAMRHDKTYKTYALYVRENVTGLSVQSPVRYNGVPVGFVQSIALDDRNPQFVKIFLRIEAGTPITTSTVATLQFQGITGVMYVGLSTKTTDAPLLKPAKGQRYPIIPSEPSFLLQLSEVLPEVTKNLRSIGKSVNKLLSQKNQKQISQSLVHINKFTKILAKNSDNLDSIIKSLNKTLKNTSAASKDLPDVMQQLDSTLVSVRKTSDKLGAVASQARGAFSSGQVAIQTFSDQLLPQTQQTLAHLSAVAANFQQLSQELKSNPAIIVRGKRPAAPGPGE